MTFPYMISFIEREGVNTYAALKPVESCAQASIYLSKKIDEWNMTHMNVPPQIDDLFTTEIIASMLAAQTAHTPVLLYSVDNEFKRVLEVTIRKY
jgi:hypothetical protein